MGGIGAVAEPLVVISLLVVGTWINRSSESKSRPGSYRRAASSRSNSEDDIENGLSRSLLGGYEPDGSKSPTLFPHQEPKWRKRALGLWGWKVNVTTPNTRRFKDRRISRLLAAYPFLVEVWYWGLIYWVYQLGRAAAAVFIVEGTVHVARHHALQVIALEQRLRIFWEPAIQAYFMACPLVMLWINRIYSFIHIPGSIAFLIWLFYYTSTRNRVDETQPGKGYNETKGSPAGPRLYESRRRTMAFCNLLAFVIFTAWPCMPPRLLPQDDSKGEEGKLARSFPFVDTVHGPQGQGSVWTDNRYVNHYAAMPSLHFGYSLLIGLTISTIPLAASHQRSLRIRLFPSSLAKSISLPSWRRLLCLFVGFIYPATILVAILATANHFLLDAVAGCVVVGLAWTGNGVMLNALPLEDWGMWVAGIHKPERWVVDVGEGEDEDLVKGVLRD